MSEPILQKAPDRSAAARASGGLIAAVTLIGSGAMIGLIVSVLAVTFASIVYTGPLETFAADGASIALLGAAAMALVGAFTMSYRGTVCGPQDVTAVTLSVATAGIAASWTGAVDDRLFATVAATVALTTLFTGLALFLIGRFKLGNFARYIPYPIIAGFLAASGLFLVLGAISTATGELVTLARLPQVLVAAAPIKWLPVIALGLLMFWASLAIRGSATLLVILLAAFVAFYGLLAVFGLSVEEARAMGLLLETSHGARSGLALFGDAARFAGADFGAIGAALPVILTVAALAAIGVMLSASGVEHATHADIGLNRDFSGGGLANIAAGALGGLPGYHLLGATTLAHVMGVRSPAAGLSAAVVCAIAFVFGPSIVTALPLTILSGVSFFLGLSLLYEGLILAGRKLPRTDLAVILVILGIAATVGILEGIATGILGCLALFVIISARQDVVLKQFTSATQRSMVDRGERAKLVLREDGARNLIYELNGPLFFGTAHRLYRIVLRALEGGEIAAVVLDFRHVHSIDSSAAHSFDKIKARCAREGAALVVTGLPSDFEARLGLSQDVRSGHIVVYPDLDEGLEWAEDRLIEARSNDGPDEPDLTLSELAQQVGENFAERRALSAGAPLVKLGEETDGYYFVESGRLSVSIPTLEGSRFRIRAVGPGALVGEVGYYLDEPRSATVVAETDCTVLHFSNETLARMETEAPSAALALHKMAACHLAVRLSENTDLVSRSR